MKTTFFSGCSSLEELKKKYKELALLHHPDRGGDTRTMQLLNEEYSKIIKSSNFEFKNEEEREDYLIYPDVINKLVVLEGLIIEVIGRWVWVSGNTFTHREALKEIGLNYARKKQMWYYRPPHEKCENHKTMDIDAIRKKYGSDIISGKTKEERVLTT